MLREVSMVCVLVAVVHALPSGRAPFRLRFDPYDATWEEFKRDYGKVYSSDGVESFRRAIFMESLATMEKHNFQYFNKEKSYYMGINQFSDMTVEEYRAYNMLQKHTRNATNFKCTQFNPPLNWQVPDTVDWRKKGYVTPVKNQGQCGSCWAFSTTGSLEGQHFRKTGKLASLSEQQLVDCSTTFGNQGCHGGLMDQAFAYINSVGGVEDEADYPYDAESGNCNFQSSEIAADLSACNDIQSTSEADLKTACGSQGPISVAIDASHASFQAYSGGIYDEPNCSSIELDHGVLVVGYGSQDGQDYWLVKNSWTADWGMHGYIMMSRNVHNQCGIATMASFPIV